MNNNSSESVHNDTEANVEYIFNLFEDIQIKLREYVNDRNSIRNFSSNDFNDLKYFTDITIQKYKELFVQNNSLFENDDFMQILYNDLKNLYNHVLQIEENINILNQIRNFKESFRSIEIAIIALKNTNTIFENELNPKIEEVKEKIKDFESLRLALEHRETSSIYLDLHDKYEKEYDSNNHYFAFAFISSVVFTLISILVTAIIDPINWVIFVSVKVLILAVAITLCTLFLRRSAHAKKLKEQAYQTYVEINAFPIHVRSLKDEDKHELIKELALKYFGKELDQTQNDKIGDLMQDQLSAGTELIKASAEMVKAKNGTKDE